MLGLFLDIHFCDALWALGGSWIAGVLDLETDVSQIAETSSLNILKLN